MSIGRRIGQFFSYTLLIIAGLVVLFPILWALSVSFMRQAEVSAFPPALLPSHLEWSNYTSMLQAVPIVRYLFNSLLVAGSITIGQVITSALAAYAFTFMRFKGKTLLFGLVMATMMVPWEVTLIPNYMTIRSLGLVDHYGGLILPFLAAAFGIFLLRQNFLQIPQEMQDAARIDGCGRFRFLWSILLPLSRGGILTLGAYTFLTHWNAYLWPLLVTNAREMRTVQIGIRYLMNEEARQDTVIMAGVILFLIPSAILLLWSQRYLVEGLTAGAVKG